MQSALLANQTDVVMSSHRWGPIWVAYLMIAINVAKGQSNKKALTFLETKSKTIIILKIFTVNDTCLPFLATLALQ